MPDGAQAGLWRGARARAVGGGAPPPSPPPRGVGCPPRPGAWEGFIFIPARHVPRRALRGWERRAPRGDASRWRGGWGGGGKFASVANSAAPHQAAGAPLSVRTARRGRPRRDRGARVLGPQSSPRQPQAPAAGRARWCLVGVPGEGRRRPAGVGLGRGTDSPGAGALRGRYRGVGRRDGGASPPPGSGLRGGETGRGLFTGSLPRQL